MAAVKTMNLAESTQESSQETAESYDYMSDAGQGFALLQLQPLKVEPKKFEKRQSKM